MILERFIFDKLYDHRYEAAVYVASVLGDRYDGNYIERLTRGQQYLRHLQAVEAVYDYAASVSGPGYYPHVQLTHAVQAILQMSEVDLDIRWENGRFLQKGDALLDERLVNDPLRWLRSKAYTTVLTPYEKGLQHLVRSHADRPRLSDVVTDMYEALEALAKIATGRDDDLSANRERFIKAVKASDEYKKLLKAYIEYANEFRHAAEEGTPKPALSPAEVESFVYMTGVFIRLAFSGLDGSGLR